MFGNLKVGLSYNSFFGSFHELFPNLEVVDFNKIEEYDLIVFPGGGDVNPLYYGESTTFSQGIDPERDSIEMKLIKNIDFLQSTKRLNVKVLGICRGSQLINVGLGGNLYQDIRFNAGAVHVGMHPLNVRNDFGEKISNLFPNGVNTFHHQGLNRMTQLTCCAEYKGIPEVSINRRKDIYAFQFHPEPDFMDQDYAKKFWKFIETWASKKEKVLEKDIHEYKLNYNYDLKRKMEEYAMAMAAPVENDEDIEEEIEEENDGDDENV